MKKLSALCFLCAALFAISSANAGYDDDKFKKEILEGLDVLVAENTAYTVEDEAPGELGADVYQTKNSVDTGDLKLYIPNSMYIRMGGGMHFGSAYDDVRRWNGIEPVTVNEPANPIFKTDGYGWGGQIGLGWNLSSYVRAEVDFQIQKLDFSNKVKSTIDAFYPDPYPYQEFYMDGDFATFRSVGGTLYFDFARRYVRTGDITRRRMFVPFMGLGVGLGTYKFDGRGGEEGNFIAPRGMLGINMALNELVGLDLFYQYQMVIGNNFGWSADKGGVQHLNGIMMSLRFNF